MCSENIWLDGIMGVVVGDALGSPAQFSSREELKKKPIASMVPCELFNTPAGSWTDDSSLTLASLDSLLTSDGYDVIQMAECFAEWLYDGKYTPFGRAYDIGRGCRIGIGNFSMTRNPLTSGGNDVNNNGNGSLMRIMPLCIYLYIRAKKVCTSMDEAIYMLHEASGITHRHLRAQMACGIYFFLVKAILDGRDSKTIAECMQLGIDEASDYYGRDLMNLSELANYSRIIDIAEFSRTPEKNIRTSGYVVDTLEAAIWNAITTTSYKECLIQAVNLGDDADTVGAIAGGLAGLYYGCDAIPDEWVNELQRVEWIKEMCEQAEKKFA